MCSMGCILGVHLFLAMLLHVLSSTVFVVYVLYGVYLGCVSIFGHVVLSFVDTPTVLYGDLYHDAFTS